MAGDLLARRPWSMAQLQTRLRDRGAPAEIAQAVVADLAARGDLDDDAFARHWVAARSGRGYGTDRLRVELRARGVAAELIDGALQTVSAADQLDRARAFIARRLPGMTGRDHKHATARLRDQLRRRGFPADTVTRVLQECLGRAVDEDLDEVATGRESDRSGPVNRDRPHRS